MTQVLFFGYDTLDKLLANTGSYSLPLLCFLCVAKVIICHVVVVVVVSGKWWLGWGDGFPLLCSDSFRVTLPCSTSASSPRGCQNQPPLLSSADNVRWANPAYTETKHMQYFPTAEA